MSQTSARVPPARTIAIASPISSPDEVEALAANGATEFYCGVAPEDWARRYGDHAWLNRRGGGAANPTPAQLALVVERAHAQGIRVSVPLNSPYYTADQLPMVVGLCRELADIGVDGLIISDPGLILALRAAGSALAIAVSSVAAVRNSATVAHYRDLGVQRVILPRHMQIADIKRIRQAVPEVELEVFALNDGCVYEEGFCATTHAAGAFCMTQWNYDFQRMDGESLTDLERSAVNSNIDDYKDWIWYLANCGYRLSLQQLPNGPCGLCAVWDFCRIGVDCLKIVGREAHPRRKLRSLQLLRTIVEQVELGGSRDEVRAYAMDLRDTPELCQSGYMCYYREAGPARAARPT